MVSLSTYRKIRLGHDHFLPHLLKVIVDYQPIPVAARSKAWDYGRSLAGIAGSNPAGAMDICLL
jgi:hypothetical protein